MHTHTCMSTHTHTHTNVILQHIGSAFQSLPTTLMHCQPNQVQHTLCTHEYSYRKYLPCPTDTSDSFCLLTLIWIFQSTIIYIYIYIYIYYNCYHATSNL